MDKDKFEFGDAVKRASDGLLGRVIATRGKKLTVLGIVRVDWKQGFQSPHKILAQNDPGKAPVFFETLTATDNASNFERV